MLFDLKAIGNLTRDPEQKTTANGTTYCTFNIAVNNRNKETHYIRVKVWGNLGESCQKYLVKGRKVFVEGELEKPYAYINREGNPDATLCIRDARRVEFLGGVERQPAGEEKAQEQAEATPPVAEVKSQASDKGFTPVAMPDDDLPF